MQYGTIEAGRRKAGVMSVQPIGAVHVPNAGGYADIFQGALQIKLEIDPPAGAHSQMCKPRGYGEGGGINPFRPLY